MSKLMTICDNCGCDFRVEKAKAMELMGKTAACHCGHEFILIFSSEVPQFVSTAPNPCEEWGGPFEVIS